MMKDKNGIEIRIGDEVVSPHLRDDAVVTNFGSAGVRCERPNRFGIWIEPDLVEVKTPVLTTPAGDERYAETASCFNKMCAAFGSSNSFSIPESVGAILRSEVSTVALLNRLGCAVEYLRAMADIIDRTAAAFEKRLVK